MKCSHINNDCIHIDTAGMTQTKPCIDCINYPAYKKIQTKYPLEQLLNMMPVSIIKDRKQLFKYSEIYELKIEKNGLKEWSISYINDLTLKTLFICSDTDIHTCAALMVTSLIENKYL